MLEAGLHCLSLFSIGLTKHYSHMIKGQSSKPKSSLSRLHCLARGARLRQHQVHHCYALVYREMFRTPDKGL